MFLKVYDLNLLRIVSILRIDNIGKKFFVNLIFLDKELKYRIFKEFINVNNYKFCRLMWK